MGKRGPKPTPNPERDAAQSRGARTYKTFCHRCFLITAHYTCAKHQCVPCGRTRSKNHGRSIPAWKKTEASRRWRAANIEHAREYSRTRYARGYRAPSTSGEKRRKYTRKRHPLTREEYIHQVKQQAAARAENQRIQKATSKLRRRAEGLRRDCDNLRASLNRQIARAERRAISRGRKRRHYEANKAAFIERATLRKKHIRRATPKWSKIEDRIAIRLEARAMAEWLGEPVHVDHIYPLKGKNVCGLNDAGNMCILPGKENWAKHRHVPRALQAWRKPQSDEVFKLDAYTAITDMLQRNKT